MPVTLPKLLAGEEPTYTRSVFEAILAGMGDDAAEWKARYVLSEDGARLDEGDAAGLLAWHPLCELMAPGSPNPLDEPWLRFPFTAKQLAALLMDGWGYFIQQRYGDWQDGPDEDELMRVGSLGGKAKEALRAAYVAFRHAEEMAPRLDPSLEHKASELARGYDAARKAAMASERLREKGLSEAEYASRLARVNQVVGELKQAKSAARQAADLANSLWRRAVVQHLLLPIEEVPAESFRNQILQSVPPGRRAEALHQMQSQREFEDSAMRKAQWELMNEISGVESEIRYWQMFNAQNITEAGRRKDELSELNTRLADLTARLDAIDRASHGTSRQTDVAQESDTQRQQRRLADLRALGGDWVKRAGSWRAKDRQSGAFGKLVEQEKRNGARNCSEKSVRRDLCDAAQAEADMKRSGTMIKGLAP